MRAVRSALFLGCCSLPVLASAQMASTTASPVRDSVDAFGIDLATGTPVERTPSIRIGEAGNGLDFGRIVRGGLYRDTNLNIIYFDGTNYRVSMGGTSDEFTKTGSTFVPKEPRGQSLTQSGSVLTYTDRMGGVGTFNIINGTYQISTGTTQTQALLESYVEPNGQTLSYAYVSTVFYNVGSPVPFVGRRLQSISSNNGYRIHLTYQSEGASPATAGYWQHVVKAVALDTGIDACTPTAPGCTTTQAWPTLTMAPLGVVTSQEYTDGEGNIWRYSFSGSPLKLMGIRYPGSATDDVVFTYSGDKVASVTRGGVTQNYAFSDAAGIRSVTVSRGGSTIYAAKFNIATAQMTEMTDALSNTTRYTYDASARLTEVEHPEGNKVQLDYDGRGNIVTTRRKAKPGSGLADIVTTASFPASCTDPKTCNLPSQTTDALGRVTAYAYGSAHGEMTARTLPAPFVGSPQPVTGLAYTNVGGAWRATSISACQTLASCAGTADESKTTIAYDSKGLVASVTESAGDGSLSATTSATRNHVGDRLTVDGPLSGTADTESYRYDASRRVIGAIGADPDGAGPRPRLAQRTTYDSWGRVSKTETGTVTDTTDPAWAAFSPAEEVASGFDAQGRLVRQTLAGGGATRELVQYSYDAAGRLDCSAVRMNPAAWASLPASACTLGTAGTDGPDRIAKTHYDANGRVVKQQSGVGTAAQADDAAAGFTANGQIAYAVDAEANRTVYSYDGHDRLAKTEYPSATKGANAANPADYEQLTHDAKGNVTSRRLRDGTSIGYGYDNLDRLTTKDMPGTNDDQSYAYDLLGRATSATKGGGVVSDTYDALGRRTAQTSHLGTTGYAYDAAGRRLSMTYPGGGLTINYDHDVTGNVTKIRENGATSGVGVLADYAYDNLGRRSSVTFGNGSVQSLGYDPVSRLSSLTNNLGGAATTHDLTQGFAYNPAGQIASATRSNDAYAWGAHYNVDRPYVIDGLNRIASVSGAALGYDPRGNLTSASGASYVYNADNRMTDGPSSANLKYDALGRLGAINGAATPTPTRFAYDGSDRIVEYQGASTITGRYVHGPGLDNPLVWYNGGTIDNITRRFLMADEHGSIVSVTDSAGATVAINSYDEQGIPAPGNLGKFGYTGQAWLPEIGMWYYKARMYSPTLGRFMQPDPIGYDDGMNMYNYVGSDPVNRTDPSGNSGVYWQTCSVPHPVGVRVSRSDANGNIALETDIVVTGNPSRCTWQYQPTNYQTPNMPPNPTPGSGTPGAIAAPPPPDPESKTDGWKCAKDVAWGAVEETVVGTVIGLFSSAVTSPEAKYSGDNAEGRRIPRSKGQYARIMLKKGVGKAGVVGAVVGGVWGAGDAYSESEACPAIF